MKKASFYFLFKRAFTTGIALLFFCALMIFCGCYSEKNRSVYVSLDGTKVSPKTLSISVNKKPARIQFSEADGELYLAFGNKIYDCYTVSLSGTVSTDMAKNAATPLDENGNIVNPNNESGEENIALFTDYITFAFPVTPVTKTIAQGTDEKLSALEKNRTINGYYLLNYKWLYISPDKQNISTFNHPNSNYFYIKTYNYKNELTSEFLIHLSYDIVFTE